MVKLTREAGLFEPEIIDTGTSVRVDFPRAGQLPARLHSVTVRDSARAVLMLIARRQSLALRELVAELDGYDERDVREELQHLRGANVIEPTGMGRGARWQLKAAYTSED